MRPGFVAATLTVLAAVLVGIAAGAPTPDTKKMVLRQSDLPAAFALHQGYYLDNARAAKESQSTLAQLKGWGRITGYEETFTRNGISGILQVSAVASTYKTVKGATASTHDSYSIEHTTQRFNGQPVKFKRVSTGGAKIGYEARMFSATLESGGFSLVLYALVWRYGVVKASIIVGGLSGTVQASQVVRLAKKQQAHIAAALR